MTSQTSDNEAKPLVRDEQEDGGQTQATIRLGCMHCDRGDCDGVSQLPTDWEDIFEVQSYEESIRPVDPDDPNGDVTFWETHMGVCPDCQEQEAEMDPGVCFREMMEAHTEDAYKTAQGHAAKLREWLDAGGEYPSDEDFDYVELMLDEVLNGY
jgi:hypothetical protein